MDILTMSIIIFCIMEAANVIILYFKPESKKGNGVAVFDNWHDAKKDETEELFVKYMVNWVAGVKLIFILLLVAVLIIGNECTKIASVVVLILSISSYFWRLNPIIKKLDKMGKITPKGYSKVLEKMILSFMIMFILALAIYFLI